VKKQIVVMYILMFFVFIPIFSQSTQPPIQDLFTAINIQDIQKLKELISAGIDVNAEDSMGNSVLMLACWTSNNEIVKTILAAGANPNFGNGSFPVVQIPCITGQYKIVKLLIDAGADINAVDKYGSTALMVENLFYSQAVSYLEIHKDDVREAQNGNLAKISQIIVERAQIINLLKSVGATTNN
jgi:ankyrin repeat protein